MHSYVCHIVELGMRTWERENVFIVKFTLHNWDFGILVFWVFFYQKENSIFPLCFVLCEFELFYAINQVMQSNHVNPINRPFLRWKIPFKWSSVWHSCELIFILIEDVFNLKDCSQLMRLLSTKNELNLQNVSKNFYNLLLIFFDNKFQVESSFNSYVYFFSLYTYM